METDKHYTVPEVAEMWNLSTNTIRKMFKDEPGVLKFGAEETRFKRGYVNLRIPQSVLHTMHSKLSGREN